MDFDAPAHHGIQSILLRDSRIMKLFGVPLEALASLLFSFQFAALWHSQSFQLVLSRRPELWISSAEH